MILRRLPLLAFALLVLGAGARAADAPPVEVRVRGCGVLENRQMVKTLRLLKSDASRNAYYDAADLEDAALILVARLNDDGFLAPAITLRVTLADGSRAEHVWDDELHQRLPRELRAARVEFRIRRGVRFHFRRVDFDGLTVLERDEARRFFMGTDFLLPQKSTRIFTPGRLAEGVRALTDALEQRGYEDAEVTVASLQRDDRTGRVKARIEVREGRRAVVRSVRREIFVPGANEPLTLTTKFSGVPFSRSWEQTFAQELQSDRYRAGFPDAKVSLTLERREVSGPETQVDLLARVETGERVRLGGVRFDGAEHTANFVMERRAALEPGAWLDRVEVEQARFRLSRLGIFDRVSLDYEPTNGPARDAVFTVREGRRTDVSLLMGYGSYELLRGGVELEQRNLFGLAHRSRLRAVQSFKSTSGDYTYTVPDLLPGQTDVFARGSYLRRQEIDFVREEYGGGLGAQRFIPALQAHAGLRFNYGRVQTRDSAATEGIGPDDAIVSAWLLELSHDRRDNPLYPRRGWNVALGVETAAEVFGGDVNYARLELSGSYHLGLGGGRWLHLGATHGAAPAFGSARSDLPFNKRFFPGGANSVRGYQEDEASPLDAQGRVIGAQTYLLGNVELEQALTPAWSLVAFFDAVGVAENLADYPFDEGLYSVGGGIRWKTIVGPVRLEYGHNLNRRPHDPKGTLHFSIGFPF